MGLTAILSSTASSASSAASASVASLLSPVGFGIGGVFVAGALIFLLGYYDVLDSMDTTDDTVRMTLIASIVPLAIAFGGVVVFQTLTFL